MDVQQLAKNKNYTDEQISFLEKGDQVVKSHMQDCEEKGLKGDIEINEFRDGTKFALSILLDNGIEYARISLTDRIKAFQNNNLKTAMEYFDRIGFYDRCSELVYGRDFDQTLLDIGSQNETDIPRFLKNN